MASSSRAPPPPPLNLTLLDFGTSRGRSSSRRREDASSNESRSRLASSNGGSERAQSPRSESVFMTSSTVRKVRTIPPSAFLDPPTPPSPAHSPLPLQNPVLGPNAAAGPSTSRTTAKPHIPYIGYSSSEESEDEEVPPWWTFTQRGMARMARLRQRSMGRGKENEKEKEKDRDTEWVTEAESGRESGRDHHKESGKSKEKRSSYFSSSRRSSRDNNATPSFSLRQSNDSPSRAPPPGSLQNPRPRITLNPSSSRLSNTLFRRTSRQDSSLELPPALHRTDSAPARPISMPTSPTDPTDPTSPGLTTLVDQQSTRLPSNDIPAPSRSLDVSPRRPARRQLTAPAFPRFFKSSRESADEGAEQTDGENGSPAGKGKPKSSLGNPSIIAPEGASPTPPHRQFTSSPTPMGGTPANDEAPTPEGGNTPSRPKPKRRGSHRLRINLPPPITQHFANGWPHAGSWQDALYGHSEEPWMDVPAKEKRGSRSGTSGSKGRKSSRSRARRASRGAEALLALGGQPSPAHEGDVESSGEMPSHATKTQEEREKDEAKKRSKRAKRFQAMAPPTPSGLGFTPRTREDGTREEDGYPWSAGVAQKEAAGAGAHGSGVTAATLMPPSAGANGDGGPRNSAELQAEALARMDTRTTTMNTEGSESTRRGHGWRLFKRSDTSNEKRQDLTGNWRKRYRRMLFLDARVTIWIRLVNLAVVVVALGLAVTIRLKLISLHLPGVLGSSTTLIIAYSSLTIVHVLTAIYREYFGRPIGLWGLRSKMLWVCLDLLFVALWSSAMSLAINDLIATPLDCTSGSAWWRNGLAEEYAELLAELAEITSSSSGALARGVTSVSAITHTLGITLPDSVIGDARARAVCRRQAGCISLSLLALLLYGGNMVLSLFRIFETVRRTAQANKVTAGPGIV
ncbi:hypothetical protein IAT38_007649 [Cryptococcus sp. DSM 104549]